MVSRRPQSTFEFSGTQQPQFTQPPPLFTRNLAELPGEPVRTRIQKGPNGLGFTLIGYQSRFFLFTKN
jgi:hypothetical protein